VLNLPSDFDPGKSYPVIDAIYGGPVSVVATRSFGSFADPQLEDHVAALQQLAERYPFLDIGRVGVYGHSNGGYLSARALLKHPDIFKVGFASASPHNFQGLPGTGAPWFGIPRYANGSAIRPEINAVPENYKVLDNAGLADQLQGKLMLVCGELDSAAFPALTMQLANALIKANKNFDFMYLPGATHMYFVQDMYVTRRLWDYFVEHLAGETPPEGFNMRKRGPEKGSDPFSANRESPAFGAGLGRVASSHTAAQHTVPA
jgi:dipeptidyl-peptidase-4